MTHRRPLSLARLGRGPRMGAGATAVVLAARYVSGGMEFQESSVHLPRDASGHYLRGGSLLVAESDITEGTTLGSYRVRGKNAGAIVGKPATGRGIGMDAITNDNYGVIASPLDANSFLLKVEVTAAAINQTPLFGADDDPEWRWGLTSPGPNNMDLRLFEGGTLRKTVSLVSSGAWGAGSTTYIAGHAYLDGSGDIQLAAWAWDASGVPLDSGTGSYVAGASVGDLAGTWFVGRGRGGGACTDITIHEAYGWAGQTLTQAQFEVQITASIAGDAVEDSDADVAMCGITAGFYDESAPTWLPEIAGTGAPVYAEDIANPQAITVPALYKAATGDDTIRTVGVPPSLPDEFTVILAYNGANNVLGSLANYARDSNDRSWAVNTISTTNPIRFRGYAGDKYADNGVVGETSFATSGLLFWVLRVWKPDTTWRLRHYAIKGGSILQNTGVITTDMSVPATGVLKVLESSCAGELAFAILDEDLSDPTVILSQLTDLYSPRNVGLSRGTLWYSPSYAVADGVEITADDIVNLGSAANDVGAWEVVTGAARLVGRSS